MIRTHRRKTRDDVIKVCKDCGQEKPHRFIVDSRKLKGGFYANQCRECRNAQQKTRKNPTKKIKPTVKVCKNCQTAKPHDWLKDSRHSSGGYFRSMCLECHYARISANWEALKEKAVQHLGGKCLDCGLIAESFVYDFHHRDPSSKRYSIGDLIKSKSVRQFDDLIEELDKCDLLCVICHRRRHYLRLRKT